MLGSSIVALYQKRGFYFEGVRLLNRVKTANIRSTFFLRRRLVSTTTSCACFESVTGNMPLLAKKILYCCGQYGTRLGGGEAGRARIDQGGVGRGEGIATERKEGGGNRSRQARAAPRGSVCRIHMSTVCNVKRTGISFLVLSWLTENSHQYCRP